MTLATAHDSVSFGKILGRFSSTEYITRPERQAHFALFGKSANRPAEEGSVGVTHHLSRVVKSRKQQGHPNNHN